MLQVIFNVYDSDSCPSVAFVFFSLRKVSQRHASVAYELCGNGGTDIGLHDTLVVLFVCCENNSVT